MTAVQQYTWYTVVLTADVVQYFYKNTNTSAASFSYWMVDTKILGLRTSTQAREASYHWGLHEEDTYQILKPAAPQTARRVHASEPTCDSTLLAYSQEFHDQLVCSRGFGSEKSDLSVIQISRHFDQIRGSIICGKHEPIQIDLHFTPPKTWVFLLQKNTWKYVLILSIARSSVSPKCGCCYYCKNYPTLIPRLLPRKTCC